MVCRLARRPDRQKGKVPSQGMGMQPHEYKGKSSSKGRKPSPEAFGLMDTRLPGNPGSGISRSECLFGVCGGACAGVARFLRIHPWVNPPSQSCFQRASAPHRRGGKIFSRGLSPAPVGVSSFCGPVQEDLRAPFLGIGSATPRPQATRAEAGAKPGGNLSTSACPGENLEVHPSCHNRRHGEAHPSPTTGDPRLFCTP